MYDIVLIIEIRSKAKAGVGVEYNVLRYALKPLAPPVYVSFPNTRCSYVPHCGSGSPPDDAMMVFEAFW
jgi:hypothetical protein